MEGLRAWLCPGACPTFRNCMPCISPQDEAKGALENFPRTVCLLQRGEGEGNRGVRSAAGIGGRFGAREPRGSVDEGAGQSQSPQAEAQFQEATRA